MHVFGEEDGDLVLVGRPYGLGRHGDFVAAIEAMFDEVLEFGRGRGLGGRKVLEVHVEGRKVGHSELDAGVVGEATVALTWSVSVREVAGGGVCGTYGLIVVVVDAQVCHDFL